MSFWLVTTTVHTRRYAAGWYNDEHNCLILLNIITAIYFEVLVLYSNIIIACVGTKPGALASKHNGTAHANKARTAIEHGCLMYAL